MGTNTVLQIRKLFEGHKFPAADVLPIFDKYFGPVQERDSSTVCSVGFEPNPEHEANLNFLSFEPLKRSSSSKGIDFENISELTSLSECRNSF